MMEGQGYNRACAANAMKNQTRF